MAKKLTDLNFTGHGFRRGKRREVLMKKQNKFVATGKA